MKCFEPFMLSNCRLKNRFIRSATSERVCDDEGHLTQEYYDIYERLAKGGVGLIITGYTYPDEAFKVTNHMAGFTSDDCIREYKELTRIVHQNETKILLQLVHGGSSSLLGKAEGASSCPHIASNLIPNEMSAERILEVRDIFVKAALRAEVCGFDGIQIHAAHGYLFSQFLDPRMNHRKDEYGGTIENRARFLICVIESIRSVVSIDFHLSVKIHCSDFDELGMSYDEALKVCGMLEKAGINSIEISGGDYKKRKGELFYAKEAAQIASSLSVPVFTVGGVRSLEVVNTLLTETSVAAVSMCRALICDPNLINDFYYGKKSESACKQCVNCKACAFPIKRPQLFASDVDGTFALQGFIPQSNIESINKYGKDRYTAFISGRSLNNLKHDLDHHQVHYDFLGAFNGGLLVDRFGKVYVNECLDFDLNRCLEIAKNYKIKGYAVHGREAVYYKILDEQSIMNKIQKNTKEVQINSLEKLDCDLYSVNIEFSESEDARRFYDELTAAQLNCQAYVNTHFVDIVSRGCGKLNAVKKLQDILGLEDGDVKVIGDSFNDLEMIRYYHGFAVMNSDDEIKATASKCFDSVSDAILFISDFN